MLYACVTYYSLHPHDEYMRAFMIIDAFIVHHPGGVGTWSSRVSSMMLLFNKGYSSRARDVACHNIDQSQRDIDIASNICVCVSDSIQITIQAYSYLMIKERSAMSNSAKIFDWQFSASQ